MKNEFLIDTDILIDHLEDQSEGLSILQKGMITGICFTTVLNSAELYFSVKNEKERKIVDNLLNALKILGLNSRYSLVVDQFSGNVNSVRDALFCSVAKNSKLPILTKNLERYKKSGIEIITPDKI